MPRLFDEETDKETNLPRPSGHKLNAGVVIHGRRSGIPGVKGEERREGAKEREEGRCRRS